MKRRIATSAALAAAAWLTATVAHAQASLQTVTYVSGLNEPVAFVQDPTDRTVQYVVQKGGRIRVVQAGALLAADFLNLTGLVSTNSERGLLGLAFAPDYSTSGRFFVNFTDLAGNTVVARFRRSAQPMVADASSRFDLRWGEGSTVIAQPYANHNGGNLAFGPDGYLYIGLGDGGSANDPENRAQTPGELLGKMLRIDVSVSLADPIGYRIPADNPFVSSGPAGVRPEIWAFGLRNPWRYSFDDPARGGTGALVIADVGQGAWEEIDYEPRGRGGRNYGWRNREGAHSNIASPAPSFLPLTDPVYEYDHGVGQSITGGFVYHGSALGSGHRGRYFFADFFGRVWSIQFSVAAGGEASAVNLVEHTAELGGGAMLGYISSFGVDADGELYIVSYSLGRVLRIAPAVPAPTGVRVVP
jgi:glucose/arabinose dehydrogenase